MLPFALWSCKPVLNCDRFIAKHALQNIQNDCHQWLSHSFKVHQIRFRPGLRPGPRWASLQRSPFPKPLSWFKGDLLLRERREKGGEEEGSELKGRREKGKRRGSGTEGEGTAPLTQISGSAPEL